MATLGALGVVYGDIGTSPLYALREAAKAASGESMPTPEAVLGTVSLITWSLIVIISLKYAVLMLRADNRGEGGIVALLAVLRVRRARPRTWRSAVLILGLVGAALLYGDGAITPAISVLSALEGLKVDAPQLGPMVLPLAVVILLGLFFVQRRGTGFIGGIFGPIMLAWFITIGILGLRGIIFAPSILAALNPTYALTFLLHAPPLIAFAVLGGTFLAVTGGEAMYADLGHFGCTPIRAAWFAIVLPALLLNYFGQGGLLLTDPHSLENPFYQLAPDWFRTLAVATLAAAIGFGSSDNLAGAYGIAVSLLMAITTFLAALVAIQWGFNPILVIAVNGFFLIVDLIFLSANSLKLLDGGWFPLILTGLIAFVMLTWRRGQSLSEKARSHVRESEKEFLAHLIEDPPARLAGTAAFLSSGMVGIPLSLTHHLKHAYALHDRVLLVTVLTAEDPRVSDEERIEITDLPAGMSRIILRYGFSESPSVPEGVRYAQEQAELSCGSLSEVSYYIGRETIIPTQQVPGMWVWRESLYAFMQRNAERSAAYFCIPATQVVEIGIEIEI